MITSYGKKKSGTFYMIHEQPVLHENKEYFAYIGRTLEDSPALFVGFITKEKLEKEGYTLHDARFTTHYINAQFSGSASIQCIFVSIHEAQTKQGFFLQKPVWTLCKDGRIRF